MDVEKRIGNLIEEARRQVYRQINNIIVQTYWEIGRLIVEEQQNGNEKAKYGENLLEKLSKELTLKYGKGFGLSNLKDMKKFHLTFPKSQTLSGQLSWSHYTALLRINK